ncbi:MAG: hypothetical protein R2807_10335 [Chitinophagales bacterium]
MFRHVVFFSLCLCVSIHSFAAANQDSTIVNADDDSLLNSRIVDNIPTVTLEDVESNDESGSDQGISPILSAGRDPFVSAASFNWGITRFKIRGYDYDFFETYVNGVPTDYIWIMDFHPIIFGQV